MDESARKMVLNELDKEKGRLRGKIFGILSGASEGSSEQVQELQDTIDMLDNVAGYLVDYDLYDFNKK